ncbi:bifunctional helix-turn-helix transcriptional regulator/GNAT family N-acetyltransferase [Glycomyces tenuis]|uniref:bifunctional helix-turn-helix transcriptional regulator/GNAT family N-acetyltransferase n=1 Tax=Glycomyces tenuis TaxID=58116 RepID=UPI000412D652|nr:helix-turn-helix domain-containing GNAT family N-acetyltransferase [Glycomyces tenuis]
MDKPPSDEHIDAVRSFNRFYTNTIGVLGDHLLDSPYTLTEVRVLFELAHRDGPDATELRRALGLDAGYLSRILARFDREGLIERRPYERDRRRRILDLTGRGREVFADLDRRSSRQVAELLAGLEPERRRRVVEAMRLIRSELDAEREPGPPVLRPLRPGDLGWVVWSQGAGYAGQFGWNEEYEALVARIAADFAAGRDREREAGWIAELDGRPAGSVFCVRADATTAKLRLLWVEPEARGRGVGAALVRRCVGFAREAGYESMVLWTVSMLLSARRLYEDAGFALETEEPVRMFGHELVAQTWRLKLKER